MAGFVQFDPDKFEPGPPAKVAKVAKAANADGPALAGLAALAAVGVRSLDAKHPPRGADGMAWACAVRDALKLIDGGWADQALALGWSALDLFGGSIDPKGDPYSDGLAVWLSGRRLLALTDGRAVAVSKIGGRFYFNLPRSPGARLLWTLGRGR